MTEKNNVIRLLESRHVKFAVFELSPEKHGAMETSAILGVEPYIVFKTIVVKRDKPGKHILAVIPGPFEVDLKQLAVAANEKKLVLPSEKEAEILTGLQAGGISPLALINKGFQVILDSHASGLTEMHISGGQRGLNIKLAVSNLVKLTNARIAPISREQD